MKPTLAPGRAWRPVGERVISALAFGGLAIFVFLLYGQQLVQGTPETLRWIWQPLGLLYLIIDFMNPAFGSVYAFVHGYLLCAGLVIAAVVAGRPRMVVRLGLLAGLAAALAYPFFLPRLYPRYTLYAQPAAGFEMRWLTEPGSAWTSAFKSAQRVHEREGCLLTLHGWSADNVLYYRSSCLLGSWAYDPMTADKPRWQLLLPTGAELVSTVAGRMNGLYPERPAGLGGNLNWYMIYETSRSPDGQWLAAAITNYYGPRDIVVLRASP